nr:hypothetical protein [Tanacetum cinerariifolium]
MYIEADEEEEEEHPAPADSIVAASTAADQAPSAEETEPFKTNESAAIPPPHPAYRMTARISIPAPVPVPDWFDSERIGIALGPGYEIGESSSTATARPAGGLRADYSFIATMDREIMHDPERESERQLLAGRLNMLFRDRRVHAYIHHMMETEARLSREAWVRSTDASDLVCGEVMSLRTTVLGQMTEIKELHTIDHKRQIVISEMLRADHRRSTEIIGLRTALQGQKQMAPRRTTRSTADQETVNATTVTNAQLQTMINQGVTATLVARDALRSTNSDDSHNSGTGNTHVQTVGHEAAYGMTRKTLMKMMTEKYCPRNEIRKLEMKL